MLVEAPEAANGNASNVKIGVISEKLEEKVDLSTYYEVALVRLRQELPDLHIREGGKTTICHLPAEWMELTYPLDKQHNVIMLQYYFLTHGGTQAYIISATTYDSDFPLYRPTLDAIAHSFHAEYPTL